jgi:hypothetical protein
VPEPRSTNETVLRQIQQAWDEAQAQLAVLKEQVQYATTMAQTKVHSNLLERDLDKAYRDLGEAVWAEVSKGKLQLPGQLAPVKKALEAVTARIRAQNASINDLLAEGEEIARLLQEKMARASKAVANPPKKR